MKDRDMLAMTTKKLGKDLSKVSSFFKIFVSLLVSMLCRYIYFIRIILLKFHLAFRVGVIFLFMSGSFVIF